MAKLPDNVSTLPKKRDTVASIADINKLVPRSKDYTAAVMKNGKKITGLVVKVTPAGRKTWRLVTKAPAGSRKKNPTFSEPLDALSYSQAIDWARRLYSEVRQGLHDRGTDIEEQAKQEKETQLNTPIVELARQRADAGLARGKISERTHKQDHVDIRHLEALIGSLTFLELGRDVAKSLGEALKNDNTKLDKIPKMIKKTYNWLSPKVRDLVPYNPNNLLTDEVPPYEKRRKPDDLVPQAQLALFWSRLMRADVDPIHKDVVLMCLLTGERISAVLEARVEHINWHYEYMYMEGKTKKGAKTKNPVPITKYLGLLLRRLANGRSKGYLFPTKRTAKLGKTNVKDHLSEPARELFDQLGAYKTIERVSPHTVRRTLANVVASAIGSQAIADEHVLHFTNFTTDAGANYLDGKSYEFVEARRRSYDQGHDLLNELIVSQGSKAGWQVYDLKESGVGTKHFEQPAPHYMIPEAIVYGQEMGLDWVDCGTEQSELFAEVDFDQVDDEGTAVSVKVTSPLAFVCNGGAVGAITVSQTHHTKIWESLPTRIDYIKNQLDPEFIENNPEEFRKNLVGHDPKPPLPNYLEQFQ